MPRSDRTKIVVENWARVGERLKHDLATLSTGKDHDFIDFMANFPLHVRQIQKQLQMFAKADELTALALVMSFMRDRQSAHALTGN